MKSMTPDQALRKWSSSAFYRDQVVLGLDIGIGGIGVYIRKGAEPIFGRTYLLTLPESAPLEGRRLKRAMRRSRSSLRHRDSLFRKWCETYGIPVVDGDAKARTDAWSLRFRAATKGVSSPEAVSVCLRHILGRRGFSYHRDNDDTLQPWGDKTDYSSVHRWLNNACFDRHFGEGLLRQLDDHEWMQRNGERTDKGKSIAEQIEARIGYYESNPLLQHIEKHLKAPQHIRERAWDTNFPRDLIEQHAGIIITQHERFFAGRTNEALSDYLSILNYARSSWRDSVDRKVKRCDYLAKLDEKRAGRKPICAKAGDLAIRHLNLIEFLGQRTVIDVTGERHLANKALYEFCYKHLVEDDLAIRQKNPRPKLGRDLRNEVEEALGMKVAKNKDCSANEHWFDQLKDLLSPRLSNLSGRANCSAEAAQILVNRALANGWDNLKLADTWADFFGWRRDLEKGYGLYPQVEFLLGRRSKRGKQATPGVLRRIFADLSKELGKDTPDVVITEVIRDVARNSEESKERERDLKRRRAEMDVVYEKHGLAEGGSHQDRVRVDLYEQQNGRCPYTGDALGNPLNPALQIDHIYPREMGGTSDRVNLVLTTAKTNKTKGKRTPRQALTDFPGLVGYAKTMKWPQRKLDLFLREEMSIPDWCNLTRTSQLARELRDAVAYWLGIKGNPDAIRQRIGSPSGLQTAQCRRSASWKPKIPEVDGKKDRENPRHHLWDAMIISHIPPGAGLQPVLNGGIFYPVAPSKPGDLGWEALDLGPDINAFEETTKNRCLVVKHRPRKSKQARTEETIYGRREDGRLVSRKALIDGSGLVNKNAGKWLASSGLPPALLPKRKLEQFLEQDKDAKPLILTSGSKVQGVRVEAPKESPVALLPHRNREGAIIGWKIMRSPYSRMEIWLAPEPDKKGKPIFQRRFIPSMRGLSSLHRLAKEGVMPWWGKKDTKGESLRGEIIGEPLKPYSRKFCSVAIGDILRVPYDAKGEVVTPKWDPVTKSFSAENVAHWAWLRATSINTSGQVETEMAEKSAAAPVTATKPASPFAIAAYKQFSASSK